MPAELLDRRVTERLTDSDWQPSTTTTTLSAQAFLIDTPKNLRSLRYPFHGGEMVVTIPGSLPPSILPTLDAIGQLLNLPQNWDSYGARSIDPSCVGAALNLMLGVLRHDTPPPSVVPTSQGGVQLEWHTRGIDLEIEFVTPSRLRGYFEDRTSGASWEADLTFDLSRMAEALSTLSRRA
jgi:hypothetical protein